PEPLPWKQSLKFTLGNKPFRMVMGLYLLSWTTASILAAVLVYFANYYLRVPNQANYFVLVAQGSAIVFIPVIVRVATWLDKKRAFVIGSITWVVILLGISVIQPHQIGLAYLLAGLSGFGIATAYVIPWSMIPDVIENDQIKTGQRREGSFYAFASFFQKLATGAALWMMGQALAATGYITPTGASQIPQQPVEAVNVIRLFI
ncbi:MAG: MFS transporter, partial [Gammaproteobacteria bacterium]|nr:MFS transporter [Gammaproteobacteria bacterium]